MNRALERLGRWLGLGVGSLLLAGSGPHVVAAAAETLAITHVTVIDATGRPPRPNSTVLVSGGRIQAVAPSARLRVPRGAVVLEGRGRYLVPGFWNMHLHAGSYDEARRALPQLLDSGVTGVRDMGAPLEDVLRLRTEIRAGEVVGPRLMIAGPLLQGPLPFKAPLILSVENPAEATGAVAALKARGVDFIKVQDALPRDLYAVIAGAAREQRIPFAGHIPPTVRASTASQARQASVEHLGGQFHGVLVGASSREAYFNAWTERLYREAVAALRAGKRPPVTHLKSEFTRPLLASYSPSKATGLFRSFARRGTWHCPTLSALGSVWTENADVLDAEDIEYSKRVLAKDMDVVRDMRRAGVGLLAGTDGPYSSGGLGLHNELDLLVQAGLTPMQALQSATRDPARFLGLLSETGTIERGKRADLVMLAANPLRDIRNTRRISAVILGGRLLPRAEVQGAALGK